MTATIISLASILLSGGLLGACAGHYHAPEIPTTIEGPNGE